MRGAIAIALLSGSLVTLGNGCAGMTGGKTATPGAPQASQEADIIIDRYRNDPKLGDDLFNDKTVEIIGYRVDEIVDGALHMLDRGFTLRLLGAAGAGIDQGAVLDFVCEGDGMSDDKTIDFEGCTKR